jgi:tetratricopeptide (TPR) repeat protein
MTQRRLFLAASLVALAALLSPPAAADPLSDAYQGVIANPTDTEVNLQYALVAEGQKKWRLALAAYERILANDPNNAAAKAGLQRIRRIIQPPETQKTVEIGTEYDSNILQTPDDPTSDWTFYAKGRVRDERNWFGQRWRTTMTAYADTHAENHDLDYMIAMFDIGPILDLNGTMMAARPFVGGAVSGVGGNYFYSEVNFGASIEGYLDGAYQWARVRAGYRDYGDVGVSSNGWYAEAAAHWAHKDIFSDRDVFFVEPWARWNSMNGSGFGPPIDLGYALVYPEITPGLYSAWGTRFEYDAKVNDWLTLGASFRFSDRDYNDGSGRNDWLFAPGAAMVFSNLLSPQTDIRLEYEFQHNNSNQDENDYDNHAVTISLVARR